MLESPVASAALTELCRTQPLAVLATIGPAGPYTNLVAVAISSNLRRLYFATPRNSRKWSNLQNSPRVSLLLDNRRNQASDFNQAVAATLLGTTQELLGKDREEAQALYLDKHPQLREFVTSPDCALFAVTIEQILLVGNFQQVTSFDFTSAESDTGDEG